MSSVLVYAFRFAQWLDLMLLFGFPLFAWYGLRQPLPNRTFHLALLVGAIVGMTLTGMEIALNAADIMGMPVTELDRATFAWYLFDTVAGRAALVRISLLAVLVILLVRQVQRDKTPSFPLVIVLAGTALLTLAWNGHAAAGEGIPGVLRLVAGIAHLLVAGAWIGAIVAFLVILVRHSTSAKDDHLQLLWQALHAFSGPGTVFVGVLVVSGVLHYGDLTGWSATPLAHSEHGRLLTFKLTLFLTMLGLAALHRWRLVPQLRRDLHAGDSAPALRALRLSLVFEATVAVLILISVAVLGTLNPHG